MSQRPAPVPPSRAARFDSPSLVRVLAALGDAESAPAHAAATAAERLGHWMDWTDAIALSAALGPHGAATGAPAPPARTSGQVTAPLAPMAPMAQIAHVRRARVELAAAITAEPTFTEASADAERCRASYRAHQRQMALRVEAARASLRALLAAQSAAGAQLAALDAVLERALAGRERQWLGTVPAWVERHLARSGAPTGSDTGSDAGADTGAAAATARAPAPGQLWQRTLLAELDTRWQPVEGLIESLQPGPASP